MVPADPRLGNRDALAIVPGLALAVIYLITSQSVAGVIGFPLDDSWIHAQFARNLATGRGFTYTGGQWVAGSTAPIWTIVLAAGYAIARNMVAAAMVLGIVLQALTAAGAYRLALALGAQPTAACAAGATTGVLPIIAWGAVSGMEVPIAAALVVWGLREHLTRRHEAGWRRYTGVALIGIGALARPETLAISAIVIASELAADGSVRDRAARAAIAAIVTIAIAAPAVVLSLATIGHPLPTTFYAKSGPGIVRALSTRDRAMALRDLTIFGPRAVANFWLILLDQMSWTAYAVPLALLLALARPVGRRGAVLLGATFLVVPFAMGMTAPQRLKPDNVRYAAQLVALVPPVLAAGGAAIPRGAAATLVSIVLLLGPLARGIGGARPYALSVRSIQSLHVATARWIAAHLPPGSVVAGNDIGALAYFGGHRILDLEGLVSPEVLSYRGYPDRGMRAVRDMRPDYILIFPAWYPDISGSPEVREVRRFQIAGNFISAGDTLILYATPWARAPLVP